MDKLKSKIKLILHKNIIIRKYRKVIYIIIFKIISVNKNIFRKYIQKLIINENIDNNYFNSKKGLVLFASKESDQRYKWFINTLQKNKIDIVLKYMPSILFQSLFEYYLIRFTQPLTNAYIKTNKYYSNRKKLRKHYSKILNIILELYSPDAFISSSIADARWRETIKVAMKLGKKWIITEREGVLAPIVFRENINLVQEAFEPEVDLVLTSNDAHKKYWKKILKNNNPVKITGELKTDIWSNMDLWIKKENINKGLKRNKLLILYFAFGKKNYVDERFYPYEKRDWSYLQKEHYSVLREISIDYRDIVQIAIKSGHKDDLKGYFSKQKKDELLENIFIFRRNHQALDLIINADIIIGFQTTALVESMFTKKPIIFAAWGGLYNDVADDLIPFHRSDALTWVKSKKEMKNIIITLINKKQFIVNDNEMINRKKFREKYFYMPDGSVGLRTYKIINDFLK